MEVSFFATTIDAVMLSSVKRGSAQLFAMDRKCLGEKREAKFRILFFESGTSGGGSFQSLYEYLASVDLTQYHPVVVFLNRTEFVRKMRALGCEVYLLFDFLYSKYPQNRLSKYVTRLGSFIDSRIPNLYLDFARLIHWPAVRSLLKIIRNEDIRLVHANDQIGRDLMALFAARQARIPCISHLRSTRGGGFDRKRADYANRTVSTFIANSRHTRTFWQNRGLCKAKIVVVYNGMREVAFEPGNWRGRGWAPENVRHLIGCVGNFHGGKGHAFLIRSFGSFYRENPDSGLVLVGDGPLRQSLFDLTKALGVADSVFFLGYQRPVLNILASLDLLVVPSEKEGFGRVILEAMQIKIPVVATNSGGIPEVIEHEKNGLLVDYGDEKGLALAMKRILEDKSLRRSLIKNGSDTVSERFGIKRYMSEVESIYDKAMKCYSPV